MVFIEQALLLRLFYLLFASLASLRSQEANIRPSLPVGLGVTKTIRWGKMPIKLRLETHYSVIRPDDFGNEWVIRFQVTPVIPNPFK